MKRFLILLLNCPAPGAHLWLYHQLCMWSTHRSLLLRLPWRTQVCCRHGGAIAAWVEGGGGARGTGKPVAMDTRGMTLLVAVPNLQQQAGNGQPWLVLLYC